jgi:hypothetical protein
LNPRHMHYRVAAAAVLITVCSCSLEDRFQSDIREYLRLSVALGERDPDSLDFYYGPPDWVGDIRKKPLTMMEIRRSAQVLIDKWKDQPEPRTQRLVRQLRAIAARADMLLGAKTTFDQETQVFFGITIPQAADLSETRSRINKLLPGKGTLATRYAAFDAKFMIPPERLPAVMTRALEGCREQTLRHFRLPAGEKVALDYVHDRPWSGFSHYQGNFHSLIEINADLGLTVDRALQLACHEGYPGHHAYNVLQDVQFVRGRRWLEWMAQPTFSPQSLVSEALATFAVEVAFPGRERLRFERDALFPLAGLNPADAEKYDQIERLVDELHVAEPAIARDFIDGKLEWVRAGDALEDQVLMAHPEEALKYLNEYRTYLVTYTVGRDLVAKRVDGWPRFEQLISNPEAADLLGSMLNK